MKKTITFLSVLAVILLFLISACVQQSKQNVEQNKKTQTTQLQGSYKIGVMFPLTGDAAIYGIPAQVSAKIAADEINAKGGVNGKKIEMIYEDSKCNPKDGNAAAQKLVNVDKVKVIIGGYCSGETLGAAPITEANKVVLISPSSSSPDITKAGDFVFRLAPSDAFAGVVASNYAFNDMKARKAAIISETTDYAQGLRNIFKENFVKLGGEIVADETYNPDDADFRTQITKVKASAPDIIYVSPNTAIKSAILIRQIREAGLKQKLLGNEVVIGAKNEMKENAELWEDIIGVEQKFDDKAPKAAALFAKYKEQTSVEPALPQYMASAYDIVYLLSDAIVKYGYDSEKIRDYLYTVKAYDGAVGEITIDENGDPIMEYSVNQVKSGDLVVLK